MKIEILLTDDINEDFTGMHCYESCDWIARELKDCSWTRGIVVIDGEYIKFNFYPQAMDGDIYTDNPYHKTLIARLVPVHVYNLHQKEKDEREEREQAEADRAERQAEIDELRQKS